MGTRFFVFSFPPKLFPPRGLASTFSRANERAHGVCARHTASGKPKIRSKRNPRFPLHSFPLSSPSHAPHIPPLRRPEPNPSAHQPLPRPRSPHPPQPRAAMPDLPCDGDGVCMVCRAAAPPEVELLRCSTCATPWHSPCLSEPPALSDAASWSCPDCTGTSSAAAPSAAPAVGGGGELVAAIRAIEADATLSDQEKARRRQKLLTGSAAADDENEDEGEGDDDDVLGILGSFSCAFCLKLPDRPVTVSNSPSPCRSPARSSTCTTILEFGVPRPISSSGSLIRLLISSSGSLIYPSADLFFR